MPTRTGTGTATGHFGELVQGALPLPGGGHEEVVATLPAPIFRCTATFVPGAPALAVLPHGGWKAREAARLTLAAIGREGTGGTVRIDNGAPAGIGAGSSTLDVVATIRAVADAFAAPLDGEAASRIAVAAEGAADPLMFPPAPVRLYAFRTGRSVATLARGLPPLRVLGWTDGVPVDSLALGRRRRFDAARLARFAALFEDLAGAVAAGDAAGIGAAATASAVLNQDVLPKPRLGAALDVAQRAGAAGVAVAHSGSLVAVLLPAGEEDRIGRARRLLAEAGIAPGWDFATGP